MKNRLMYSLVLVLLLSSLMFLPQMTDAVPKNGKVRVSGDNAWVVFVNGEELAQSMAVMAAKRMLNQFRFQTGSIKRL